MPTSNVDKDAICRQPVWTRDPHSDGYIEGWIVSPSHPQASKQYIDYGNEQLNLASQDGDNAEELFSVHLGHADTDKDSSVILVKKSLIQWKNPSKYEFSSDLSDLAFLNEPSVLHSLENRFKNDQIYTYSGLFLVSINPYKWIPSLYHQTAIQSYKGKGRTDNTRPHIFAIADEAYSQLLATGVNQSILVTGESGAGKTENTKKIIQYLAFLNSNDKNRHCSAGDDYRNPSAIAEEFHSIEQKILCANPILESFGNAKTIKNDNSSRFGKFIRLQFDNKKGHLMGATVDCYLLEKSRVTHHGPGERSFHVFYQLIRGAPSPLKSKRQECTARVPNFSYIGKKYGT